MKKSLMLVVLAVAILLVIGVSSAFAAETTTVVGVGSPKSASDTVFVKASVNAKLVLSVTTPNASQTVDFGTVDPGSAQGPTAVTLAVWSNKPYNVSVTKVNDTVMGLTTTLGNSAGNVKTTVAENATGHPFTDNYSLNVPWNVDPGNVFATVLYTVVQP
jgi:hypothetical protein